MKVYFNIYYNKSIFQARHQRGPQRGPLQPSLRSLRLCLIIEPLLFFLCCFRSLPVYAIFFLYYLFCMHALSFIPLPISQPIPILSGVVRAHWMKQLGEVTGEKVCFASLSLISFLSICAPLPSPSPRSLPLSLL